MTSLKPLHKKALVAGSFFIAYFLAAKLGLLLATINSTASPFWPPTGIAIAGLFIFGSRYWPAVFLGALLSNLLTDAPNWSSLPIAIGNTLEALAGVYIIRSVAKFKSLVEFQNQTVPIILASALAPLISASIGVVSLVYFNVVQPPQWSYVWLTWWIGDMIGALLLLPLLMKIAEESFADFKFLKNFLLIVLVLIFFYFIFVFSTSMLFIFMIFPAILYVIFQTSSFIPHLLTLLLALSGIFLTATGAGLFNYSSMNQNLLHLQVFMTVLGVTTIVLAEIKMQDSKKLTVIVLLVGWILSSASLYSFHISENRLDRVHFNDLIDSVQNRLQKRLIVYEDVLMGASSYISSSEEVTFQEWKHYTEYLNLTTRYPGIHGLGLIEPVPRQALAKYEADMRKKVTADFEIKKLSNIEPQTLYVISLIAPWDLNKQAIGLDIATDANRKLAADRARDSGKPVITHKTTLFQDVQKRAGFLLLVPIYVDNIGIKTVAEKREKFRGWVYAPFIAENTFKGVLEKDANEINFEVYQSDQLTVENFIYSSLGQQLPIGENDVITSLDFGEEKFTLVWKLNKGFVTARDSSSLWVLVIGSVITLLFGILTSVLKTLSQRANAIAEEKTRLLRENEKHLIAASEKALEGARVKSHFLANMSHEIRTPINGIVGMAQLLKETPLDEQQNDYLDAITKSSTGLINIVNDILDFSKIEANKMNIEIIDFDLRSFFADALRSYRFLATQRKIEFFHDIHVEIPNVLKGDPGRIQQVLTNLVSNAIKFTKDGFVRVDIFPVEDSGQKKIKFQVTDSGIGIPEEKINLIFDSFTQADASTTREYGGTGLGLSISRDLVKLMDGKMGVTSDKDMGSIFWFTIPLVSGVLPEKKDSKIMTALRKAKILVAEDNTINQIVAVKNLERLGYQASTVANGIEAIQAIKDFDFDLVLMDCQMPELDGYEATRMIRRLEDKNKSQIPVIAMTANAMKGDREKCLEAGMNDYLSKPLNNVDLSQKLYHWLFEKN